MPSLADLNEQQRKAALHIQGPCVVVAGAGSGKTAMLVTRVQHLLRLQIPPNQILCCTFTKDAAKEMQSRIKADSGDKAKGVKICTIHSLAYQLIMPRLGKDWKIQTSTSWIIELILSGPSDSNPYGVKSSLSAKDADQAISKAKNSLKTPFDLDDMMVADIYEAYEKFKKDKKILDFDDLLVKTVHALRMDTQFREKWQNQWKFILVDEFQDTNLVQWEILSLLAKAHQNLFVVGDDWQSLYSWRGAMPSLILDFGKYYPNAKTIILERNYRSRDPIIQASNLIISMNEGQFKKQVVANRPGGDPIKIIGVEDEVDQAKRVADIIEAMRLADPDLEWKSFAILYRTHEQSRSFEEIFTERDLPYVMAGESHFYEMPKIKTILTYMRIVNSLSKDEAPEVQWVTDIINRPKRNIKPDDINRVLVEGLSVLTQYPVYDPILDTLDKLMDCEQPAELIVRLDEIHPELMKREPGDMWYSSFLRAASKHDNIESFLSFCDYVIEKSKEPKDDAIVMKTVHGSKGEQYPVVFLVDMVEGVMPYQKSVDEGNIEEETRIAYVAATRAQDRLYFIVPKMMGDKVCIPSRYVTRLLEERKKK
ncbi:ATP-dependent helicase [Alicyclobacillus fodiniaquatilis]|uniref:DNA 3'-5' helicase n=1 Tax=Alicyclobacillus fodiniaquatilis TaxID=1661150 RepID=A0ABW4JKG9_9BACL